MTTKIIFILIKNSLRIQHLNQKLTTKQNNKYIYPKNKLLEYLKKKINIDNNYLSNIHIKTLKILKATF